MNLLSLVPAGVLAAGLTLLPESWLGWLPMPLSAWAALALVAVVAVITRQGAWLYPLAVAVSLTLGLQFALTSQPGLARAALIIQLGPTLACLFWLVFHYWRLPPVVTLAGGLTLLATSVLPALILWYLPLDTISGTPLLDSLLVRPVAGVHLSWLHWIVASMLGVWWLGQLYEQRSKPQTSGLAGMTLAVWVGLANLAVPYAIDWLTVTLAASIVIALVLELVRLAYLDELTGLPQRRALENRLQRLRKDAILVMLDVDHFKTFNDTWGHDTGDQVLALLGTVLGRARGVSAFRYGGEEFTLLVSGGRQEKVQQQLDALREEIAGQTFRVRQSDRPASDANGRRERGSGPERETHELNVTVSMGCARRASGETPEALLKRADNALYKAKKAGRNRVVCDFPESG